MRDILIPLGIGALIGGGLVGLIFILICVKLMYDIWSES